jgi:CubicO group peptidase (beta-lactamase class C family)
MSEELAAKLQEFDEYVNSVYQGWDIPGLAIAVVKDDEIVFAKGYGVRKLGEVAPVDEDTVFAIGSASKAFTAAAVAMLVDEGKLKWDDPVSQYLPDLRFSEPYVDKQMTVRDLLTHRSGLARTDFIWYGQSYSRQEILQRVRHIEPASSFRTSFGYQNVMYLAAGELIPAVTGQSYDDFIRERFFEPLEMTRSNTSTNDLPKLDNVANPHSVQNKKLKVINWRNIDNIAPAGSINSSVKQMINWVKLHLNDGKFGDKQLISPASVKELHTSQFIIPPVGEFQLFWMSCPDMNFLTYGLGWFIQDYKGRKVSHHGGNIDGMSAMVSMIPSEKLGVVILTNLNSALLPVVLHYKLHDVFLGGESRDWSAYAHDLKTKVEAMGKDAAEKQRKARLVGTQPSLKVESYAGEYEHKANGKATITLEGNGLVFRFGEAITADLDHWHLDSFALNPRDFTLTDNNEDTAKILANFSLNADAKVEEVKIALLGDFKKVPEPPEPTAEAAEAEAKAEAVEAV